MNRRTRPTGAGPSTRRPARKTADSAASLVGSETRELPIDVIDWSLALRDIKREHVGRLGGATTLPPVVVWEFDKDQFRGVDGFHRWYLAKLRGKNAIQVVVRHYASGQSGEQQFEFESIRMNIQHGLPLTRAERDCAIRRLWSRWGRIESRPHGVSLDQLGRTFNLTKQRVRQIVMSKPTSLQATEDAMPGDAGQQAAKPDLTRSTGFSKLGRFTAAAKRLSTVLGDVKFVRQLFEENQVEVREMLQQLRDLLDNYLASADEPPAAPRPRSPGGLPKSPGSAAKMTHN